MALSSDPLFCANVITKEWKPILDDRTMSLHQPLSAIAKTAGFRRDVYYTFQVEYRDADGRVKAGQLIED